MERYTTETTEVPFSVKNLKISAAKNTLMKVAADFLSQISVIETEG